MFTLGLKALFPNIFLASLGGSSTSVALSRTCAFATASRDELMQFVAGKPLFLVCLKGLALHVLVAKLLNSEVLIRSYFY